MSISHLIETHGYLPYGPWRQHVGIPVIVVLAGWAADHEASAAAGNLLEHESP